jgi:hypothetical protein
MTLETRIYVAGTLEKAPAKRPGPKPIYKHFSPEDSLYYKDGYKYRCIVDDLDARGYVLKTPYGERFLPHDWDDLIFYEEALRLAKQAGVFFPKLSNKNRGYRTPPPLLTVSETRRKRPAWNRSAILRHIDETLRRKNNGA